jgi:hypothetical protein
MSGHSAKPKTSARSAKTIRKNSKKTAKSARSVASITKLGRRAGPKVARSTRVSLTGVRAEKVKERDLSSAAVPPATTSASVAPLEEATTKSASSSSVPTHKYHVGEIVYYTPPNFGRAAASGTYTVVKLLPSESEDYQYRIKSISEAFERVAKESQLDKV